VSGSGTVELVNAPFSMLIGFIKIMI